MKDLLKSVCTRHGIPDDKAELIATEQWNLIFEAKILTTTEELRNDLICAVQDEYFGGPDD